LAFLVLILIASPAEAPQRAALLLIVLLIFILAAFAARATTSRRLIAPRETSCRGGAFFVVIRIAAPSAPQETAASRVFIVAGPAIAIRPWPPRTSIVLRFVVTASAAPQETAASRVFVVAGPAIAIQSWPPRARVVAGRACPVLFAAPRVAKAVAGKVPIIGGAGIVLRANGPPRRSSARIVTACVTRSASRIGPFFVVATPSGW
jgi:hypothetical protein